MTKMIFVFSLLILSRPVLAQQNPLCDWVFTKFDTKIYQGFTDPNFRINELWYMEHKLQYLVDGYSLKPIFVALPIILERIEDLQNTISTGVMPLSLIEVENTLVVTSRLHGVTTMMANDAQKSLDLISSLRQNIGWFSEPITVSELLTEIYDINAFVIDQMAAINFSFEEMKTSLERKNASRASLIKALDQVNSKILTILDKKIRMPSVAQFRSLQLQPEYRKPN